MAERVPQNPVYQLNPMEYMPPNPAGEPAVQVQDNPVAVGAVPPETEAEQPEEAPSQPPVDGSNLPTNIATLQFLFNLGIEEHRSANLNIPNGNTRPAREDISSVETEELSSLVEGNTTPAREDTSSVETEELSSLVEGNTTPAREDTSSVEIDELSSLVDRLDIDQSPEEQAQSIEHGKIPAIGFTYTGEKSVALKIMLKMGYEPGKGLGSSLPGIVNPVEARGTHGRQGLGYSPPEQEAAKPEGDSSLEVLYQNQPSGALQHLEDIMVPDYPAVRMTALTFYEHLCVLLRTSSLVQKNSNPIQVQKYCFVLSSRQLIEIGYSKFKRNGKLEVQLRICKLDTETVQKDAFPPKLTINVNGHCVQLKTAPSSRPGLEPEPIPGPIDIEEYVHPTSSKYNDITIYWDSELGGMYAVTVNLVRPLPLQKVVSSSSSEKEDDNDQEDDDDEDDDDDIVDENDACNGEVNQLAGTGSSTSTSSGTNKHDGAVASTSSGISHQTCVFIHQTFSDSD